MTRTAHVAAGIAGFVAMAAIGVAEAQTTQGDVVVTAPSPKVVPHLLEQFGERFSGDRLARWAAPICPYVIGLSREHDAFIARRIGEVARAAGLRVSGGQCDVNIMVVISAKPDELRAAMVRRHDRIFGLGRWGADKLQLADFERNDGAPAHVFYVNGESVVGSGGTPANQGSSVAGTNLTLDQNGPPVVQGYLPSRLAPHVEPSLERVVLVLDGRRLTNLPVSQIAAYAAVVTLAEIRTSQPVQGVKTITTLFADLDAGRTPAEDLTFWDRAYLGALYGAEAQSDFSAQRSAMSNRIAHAIESLDLTPGAKPINNHAP